MIRKVKFNNFYSFEDKQEISFLAKKKNGYDYFQSKSGDQITKVAGFVGGNASGKTNAMKLFSFISHFICKSGKINTDSPFNVAFKTFFNNKEVSTFYIEFEVNDFIYYYDLSVKNNTVIREELSVKKITKGSRIKQVFLRHLNDIKELNEEYFQDFSMTFLKNIRSDISLIAFLEAYFNIEIINIVFGYFLNMKTNINEKGDIYHTSLQFRAVEMYMNDPSLKEDVEEFIRSFDMGLNGFEIKKEKDEDGISMSVHCLHDVKEKNNKLDFSYESRGTQSLFFVLAYIINALKNNSVVIIDEIETGLHPEALEKLITYFIDKNETGTAQLIFSSHSLGFMNRFDMHQINLVQKEKNCESFSYRLSELEGIRSDDNFLAKYMTGVYGAFPKIRV